MYETLWQFRTRNFTIQLTAEEEPFPDLSWADAETLEKLENGTYQNVCFKVAVICNEAEIGADYLGNSVYENLEEFIDHRGMNQRNHGSYFSAMVREAICEARKHITKMPKLRASANA